MSSLGLPFTETWETATPRISASRAARGLHEAAFRVVREVAIVAEAVADARHVAGFRVVNMLDGSVNFAAGEND